MRPAPSSPVVLCGSIHPAAAALLEQEAGVVGVRDLSSRSVFSSCDIGLPL